MQFPDGVGGAEPIARYLLENSKYSSAEMRVKYSAFMPAPDNILSVFRVAGMEHAGITELGNDFVAAPQARNLKGYAIVAAQIISDRGLDIVPTLEPHPRHADVVGWSEKDANRSRAQIIAEYARLVLA